MTKLTKREARADLVTFLDTITKLVHGAVYSADFADSEVRALLIDMLQDEIDELWAKWDVAENEDDND